MTKKNLKKEFSKMVKGENPRRFGYPRSDTERRKRHLARFGTGKLPPRGSGGK